MDDIFIIKIPKFQPQYKRSKKYGYKNSKEKRNLQEVLEESTCGYCMYCYARIRVDGKFFANLEHAIEKINSKRLMECIPNIGLACTTCNQVFKKRGENDRKLPADVIMKFDSRSRCSVEERKQCTVACTALKDLQNQYHELPGGKIILQPMGVSGKDTGEQLELQYDVLHMEFQPASNFHTYSESELSFIDMHIKKFRLNDASCKTRQMYDFVRNIIDNQGKIPHYEYNNLIVDLFCRQIRNKPVDEILKICRSIFCAVYLKA